MKFPWQGHTRLYFRRQRCRSNVVAEGPKLALACVTPRAFKARQWRIAAQITIHIEKCLRCRFQLLRGVVLNGVL